MKRLALCTTLLLGACQPQVGLPPDTPLPPFPADLRECFKKGGVEIPKKALTAGEVARLWAQDRIRIVALRQCGQQSAAFYDDVRAKWR